MKDNTSDIIAKKALILVGVPFLIICIIGIAYLFNDTFGNPISKNLLKKQHLNI